MFNIKAFPLPLKVKVCVCSFYLHFIFKIDGQTDDNSSALYRILLQSSRSAGIIVILAPPPLRVNPWEAGGLKTRGL